MCFFFFFKQKTAYEIGTGDWSSDVCSSDLAEKKRFKKNPTNFAVRKHELMKEKVTKILIYLFYFFILFLTYPLMDVYLFCPFYHFFVFFNWECEKVL